MYFYKSTYFQDCNNKLSEPTPPQHFEENSLRRNFDIGNDYYDNDYYDGEEDEEAARWITPVDVVKDIMGTVAYVGQAVFAPWTLPGQPFSVDPEQLEK